MSMIDEGQVAFRLGKIYGLTLVAHRHNCGKGPYPEDCSRLDMIAAAIADLAADLSKEATGGN